MDARTKQVDHRFRLGGANKYRDRPGAGCFGSVPDVVSTHSFGWDRADCCFYAEDWHGIGGTVTHRAHMPVELAEQFLMSCLYEDFRQTFLIESYGAKEPAEELLRAMGHTLKVSRGIATPRGSSGRYWLPGLTIACTNPQGKTESLGLFYELRNAFGQRMTTVTVSKLQKGLGLKR